MTREEQAFKRLWKTASKNTPVPSEPPPPAYPIKVLELSCGHLRHPTRITFHQKHGVWFYVQWDSRAVGDLSKHGLGTEIYIMRFARNNNLQTRWL